ncbi:hypothetical protein ACWEQ4_00820 [Rhodococcus sp. NPDC003994]
MVAALLVGVVTLYVNRRKRHETLKTFVEIYDKLPDDMPQRAALKAVIATELDRLTEPRKPRMEAFKETLRTTEGSADDGEESTLAVELRGTFRDALFSAGTTSTIALLLLIVVQWLN